MTIQNMASVNTLFKKGYLLAGVVMAANMFIVNEMKATEKITTSPQTQGDKDLNIKEVNNNNQGKEKIVGLPEAKSKPNILVRVLSLENTFNLIGGVVSSVANNYFKWWNYNAGTYREIGCFGWRSKRFLNDILQFEVNFNLGRGALWSIPNIITLIRTKTSEKGESEESKKDDNFSWVGFFFGGILRGFTSMPLTFHISKFNFSISISLDSIIWMGIGKILELKGEKDVKKNKKEKNLELENQNDEKNNAASNEIKEV